MLLFNCNELHLAVCCQWLLCGTARFWRTDLCVDDVVVLSLVMGSFLNGMYFCVSVRLWLVLVI